MPTADVNYSPQKAQSALSEVGNNVHPGAPIDVLASEEPQPTNENRTNLTNDLQKGGDVESPDGSCVLDPFSRRSLSNKTFVTNSSLTVAPECGQSSANDGTSNNDWEGSAQQDLPVDRGEHQLEDEVQPVRRPKKRRQVSVDRKNKKIRMRCKKRYLEIKVERKAKREEQKANGTASTSRSSETQRVQLGRTRSAQSNVAPPAGATRFSQRLRAQKMGEMEDPKSDREGILGEEQRMSAVGPASEDEMDSDPQSDVKEDVEEKKDSDDELPAILQKPKIQLKRRKKFCTVNSQAKKRRIYDRQRASRIQEKDGSLNSLGVESEAESEITVIPRSENPSSNTQEEVVTRPESSSRDSQFEPGTSTSRKDPGNLDTRQDYQSDKFRRRMAEMVREHAAARRNRSLESSSPPASPSPNRFYFDGPSTRQNCSRRSRSPQWATEFSSRFDNQSDKASREDYEQMEAVEHDESANTTGQRISLPAQRSRDQRVEEAIQEDLCYPAPRSPILFYSDSEYPRTSRQGTSDESEAESREEKIVEAGDFGDGQQSEKADDIKKRKGEIKKEELARRRLVRQMLSKHKKERKLLRKNRKKTATQKKTISQEADSKDSDEMESE